MRSLRYRLSLATTAALTLTLISSQAHAQSPLQGLDREMVGPRAELMVLGTVHLQELGKDFKPASVGPLLAKLERFKPDIITIEAMPGEECDLARRHPGKYGDDYCKLPTQAQLATGLDIPGALAEVDKTLKTWPKTPTAGERRRLAALFMAAREPASAYVQWLQLPASERHAGELLNDALVQALQGYEQRPDESFQIAARLAARLGLARVHPIDNHTGDNVQTDDAKAFLSELEAAWKASGNELSQDEQQIAALKRADDLLPLYRHVNRPEHARMLARMNIVGPMASKSAQRYPQMWVGGWEVRNLRMVANIRETYRERPGARVLSIVGASHKPWFDQWLGQMQGAQIVDSLSVLR